MVAAHHEVHDGDRFVPLLLTLFFFVLGCNLLGMVPWAGSPTASFSVTLALAGVTFLTVVAAGMLKFGFLGFFGNQVPSMDLPLPLAILLKPMIFAIEMLGLCIKHLILAPPPVEAVVRRKTASGKPPFKIPGKSLEHGLAEIRSDQFPRPAQTTRSFRVDNF
ncbi:MAG: hypothetical protein EBR23_03085 [Planctomycetia bacterium]|nr:hypothetical protein [Planctomycetia bacterium]